MQKRNEIETKHNKAHSTDDIEFYKNYVNIYFNLPLHKGARNNVQG